MLTRLYVGFQTSRSLQVAMVIALVAVLSMALLGYFGGSSNARNTGGFRRP